MSTVIKQSELENRRLAGAKVVSRTSSPVQESQKVDITVESEPVSVEVELAPVQVNTVTTVDATALMQQIAALTAVVQELIELRKNPPSLGVVRSSKDGKILRINPIPQSEN